MAFQKYSLLDGGQEESRSHKGELSLANVAEEAGDWRRMLELKLTL